MINDERADLVRALPRLRRYARGLAGSQAAGDDLVQDAMERALRAGVDVDERVVTDAWLFRVVRNLYLNTQRAERVRQAHAAAAQPRESVDGQRTVEAHLTLGRIRDTLGCLPEEQRSVLLLVCVEGFSYAEAARILDVSSGTIASRVSRARLALHAHLAGDHSDACAPVLEGNKS